MHPLAQFHAALSHQLLGIDGMTTQPYIPKTGKGPAGGIDDFILKGRTFVSLRLTDQYVMLYAGPVLSIANLSQRYDTLLKPLRSGKGCLKITRPDHVDVAALNALFAEAAARWE